MTINDTATEAPVDNEDQEPQHDYSNLTATVALFDKVEDEEERQNLIYGIALWVIPLGDIKLRTYKNALVAAKAVKPGDWNDAVKEARASLSAKARAERDDMFDGLPEAPPAPYYTDDDGLYFNSHFGPVHLANFVPMVTEEVTRHTGAEIQKLFTLKVASSVNGAEGIVQVTKAGLKSARDWTYDAIGGRGIIYPCSRDEAHVVAAAQFLSLGMVEERTTYAFTGWTEIDGRQVFLTSTGALGADGMDETTAVDLGTEKLNRYALPAPDKTQAADAVKASLALLDLGPDKVMAPQLCATYRAPLPLQPETTLWTFGGTGAFKSHIAALFAQHFGPELTVRGFPTGWQSTANAMEGIAFQLANVLMVVDDYVPQAAATKTDLAKLNEKVERLVRGSANSAGRSRMRVDGTVRPELYPRAQVVCTGEDVPPGQSLQARTSLVEIVKDDVTSDRLTPAQRTADEGVYAQAMAGYVQWLAAQYESIEDWSGQLKVELGGVRNALAKEAAGHARAPEAVAGLLLGMRWFLRYAQEIGAVTDEEKKELYSRCRTALLDGAAVQSAETRSLSAEAIYLSAIRTSLTNGRAYLADLNSDGVPPQTEAARWGWARDDMDRLSARGEKIGWVSGTDVYLDPGAAYTAAVAQADRMRTPLQTSRARVHKALFAAELLPSADPGHLTTKVSAGGARPRVLHLKAEALTRWS
ncbi:MULTISPECIES: hypothetical protein [Streptomyces]|uniref:DUF927 domain-containing protein n=1 Tax=Streptomyces dengpaensis TaxID=2049881 RepID=A0ABM6SU43_9ACTN|nr:MULTISPECIES: hypothetical protein [Streptomyces]AVH57864.1 hypothetical protein C4B68_21210 [Streptomyces dengpaensis]PIB04839.1 hypothetical protein B1C81_31325 [Streptomyces sp. HG99]